MRGRGGGGSTYNIINTLVEHHILKRRRTRTKNLRSP